MDALHVHISDVQLWLNVIALGYNNNSRIESIANTKIVLNCKDILFCTCQTQPFSRTLINLCMILERRKKLMTANLPIRNPVLYLSSTLLHFIINQTKWWPSTIIHFINLLTNEQSWKGFVKGSVYYDYYVYYTNQQLCTIQLDHDIQWVFMYFVKTFYFVGNVMYN